MNKRFNFASAASLLGLEKKQSDDSPALSSLSEEPEAAAAELEEIAPEVVEEVEEARAEIETEEEPAAEVSNAGVERARWAAVFSSKEGDRNRAMATELLSETDLSADQIVGILSKMPAAEKPLAVKMQENGTPNLGTGASAENKPVKADTQLWDRAIDKLNASIRKD